MQPSTLCYYYYYYYFYTTTTILHLSGLCWGLPGWASTRNVKPKPIWISWSKRQWVASAMHMQICTSCQTDNHARTQLLSFLQDRCPSCHPTNSIKAMKVWAPCWMLKWVSA